jgi:hypothetical protein
MSERPLPNESKLPLRDRTRGAIRTHLGRKRAGGRTRLADETLTGVRELAQMRRSEQERAFDRMHTQFRAIFEASDDKTAAGFDRALDAAGESLVASGAFSPETAQLLRRFLRRDLLQKDHPSMTFRSHDITSAGTLACEGCGWTVIADRSTVLPACPQCGDSSFRKSD